MTAQNGQKYGFETLALHGGQEPDAATNSRAVPIYQTTAYLFNDADHASNLFNLSEMGNIYTRIMNPTSDVFEQRMAQLEGGVGALAVGSGQAAEFLAILNILGVGDELLAATSLYGGTYNLFHHTLPKVGIKVNFTDPSDPENFRRALTDRTRAIYAESVGNPRLDTLDIEAVAQIAHRGRYPADHRQHVAQSVSFASAGARGGYRRPLGNEVYRWARNEYRWSDR